MPVSPPFSPRATEVLIRPCLLQLYKDYHHHRLLRQKAASHNKIYNKNTETNLKNVMKKLELVLEQKENFPETQEMYIVIHVTRPVVMHYTIGRVTWIHSQS